MHFLLFVFQLLCIIVKSKDDVPAFKNYQATAAPAAPAAVAPSSPKAAPAPVSPPVSAPPLVAGAPSPPPAGGRVFATPFAKKLAADRGIDLQVKLNYCNSIFFS
jgi:pyruvate dehydrogenase E2 component (dihydrolipoamide acetyltransferase)